MTRSVEAREPPPCVHCGGQHEDFAACAQVTAHTKPLSRFDCGNGGAQFCDGCYRMEPNELGDYVRYEDAERMQAALIEILQYDQNPQAQHVARRGLGLLTDDQMTQPNTTSENTNGR